MSNERMVWDEALATVLEGQWAEDPRHDLVLHTAAALVPEGAESVLDVGCGFGDLYPLLTRRGIKRYVGVDASAAMLRRAVARHPGVKFCLGTVFTLARPEFCGKFPPTKIGLFDCVVACALLVHLRNIEGAIGEMWGHTKQALICNFQPTTTNLGVKHQFSEGTHGELLHRVARWYLHAVLCALPFVDGVTWHRVGDDIWFFKVTKG